MEQFARAKTVRLRSSHGKYLYADEDKVSVSQERDPGKNAVWQVELVHEGEGCVIRLKSTHGGYLTASDEPFLLGMTGKKVVQSKPEDTGNTNWLESWIEWEPAADQQSLVKLRTRHGNYLRGNGGIPPWRNSVTHDVPVRSATQNWVLWGVETVESIRPKPISDLKLDSELVNPQQQQHQNQHQHQHKDQEQSTNNNRIHEQRMQQQLSFKIPVSGGRRISYAVVSDENEEIAGNSSDWPCFYFKGHTLTELRNELKLEVGAGDETDLTICTRNAFTGKLHPLQLGLPPNNAPMNLVVLIK